MKVGRNDLCPCGSGKKYKHCCLMKLASPIEPILLLFGAGASVGSLGTNEKPPLGTELFGKLSQEYPATWGVIPGNFAGIFRREGFEAGMNSLWVNNQSSKEYNLANLLADMGIFFSKFRINDTKENLYCRLFEKYRTHIIDGKLLLSTLNYDCLIEYALMSLSMNTIDYLGRGSGVKLLKLHGSCNFIPQRFKVSRQNATLILGTSTINTPFQPVEPDKVKEALSSAPFSVMSLYTREKNNIISPKGIQDIQTEFQQTVGSAKEIISIGVRPDTNDKHIWEYIQNSNASLILCGNKSDCMGWISHHRTKDSTFIGTKFQSSLDAICDKIDMRLN